jgi:hypothetical protein
MTISLLAKPSEARQTFRMSELAEALSLSSLVAGSLEYAIVIRHRQERRQAVASGPDIDEAALEALARVSGTADRWRLRRWTAEGTRFRIESGWPNWPRGRRDRVG